MKIGNRQSTIGNRNVPHSAFLIPRFALFLALLFAAGCVTTPIQPPPTDKSAGSIQSVQPLNTYTAAMLRPLLWWTDFKEPIKFFNGIRIYRLEYWTTDPHGLPTVASGLVAMPDKVPIRGTVSYQHGTNTNRHAAPSKPTVEGTAGCALFAGAGYMFCATDYIGLGTNYEPHPYLHAETEAGAAADLLKAAKQLALTAGITLPPDVYLVGFSQGGHATMALQRKLESMQDAPFRVAAAAGCSGAYDLLGITIPATLEGKAKGDSLYLALLAYAYSTIYDQPLDSLLKKQYADIAPTLFDGEHKERAIIRSLPRYPREMFTSQFLDAFDNHKPHWFIDALDKNEVYRFTPRAPVRLYYGEKDVDVPPLEAIHAETEFRKNGANAIAIDVGPYKHVPSIIRSIPKVRSWFDQLTNPK